MRTHHHQLIAVLALLGCGRPTQPPVPVEVKPETQTGLKRDGLTGLAVVPGTHDRLWLKRGEGVLNNDGKVVFADPNPYDDLVALDADRIALIMRNDGYVYQLSTHKLLNRFCYLPDSFPPEDWQQSFVVGWDVAGQRLYVQPQTFNQNGPVGGAQVGVFAADQATPLEWQTLSAAEAEMQAGGIAVESRERIWLGWKSQLYLYDATARAVKKTLALEVNDISALAIDGDTLLVLDSSSALSSVPLVTLR